MAGASQLGCSLFVLLARPVGDAWSAVLLISAGSFCASMGGPCAYAITIDMGGRHVAPVFSTMNMAGNVGAMLFPLLIPWLVPYLPGGPPFHWHDLAALQRPRGRAWWGVAISAAIGGLSHLLLDGFTHGDRSGWLVPLVPLLRWPLPLPWGALPLYDALHPVSTVLFGVGAFAIWRRLAAGRLLWVWRGSAPRRVAEAPPAARRTLVRWLLFCTACGALAASLVSPAGSPLADVVELTAYGALDALWLGLLLAALAARFGPPLSQPLLFLDDALEG